MRVALYARFSSDLQDPRSVEDQLRAAREFAARQGWLIIAEFRDEAVSGASMHNRPGLLDLIEKAQKGLFQAVVTESLDRLSRNQADMAAIFEKLNFFGVEIVTLADGPISELHVGLKGTMAALFLKDLAQKTRRGQIGRVKAGRIPGGRCYGYEIGGEGRGTRTINEREAAVVRQIFTDYVAGLSPLDIVHRLNAEGIPGPRGGQWNVSALLGSAKRKNGILNNSLYHGVITYNRQKFLKDPATGKRQARANPPDEWITSEVPELAIVSKELFEAAQSRRATLARPRPEHHRRPKHLLSGLLVCDACGGSMIVRTRKKGATYFGCSVRMNRKGCSNNRNVPASEIERRVLVALRRYLLDPDVVAEAVDAYRRERQRLSREHAKARGSVERELADVNRRTAQVLRAIEDGGDTKVLVPRLNQLRAQAEALESQLAAAKCPDVIELHPLAAKRYRQKVEEIQKALTAGDAAGAEAVQLVRDLIQRVRVIPTPKGEPVGLEIAGDLAAILNLNKGGMAVM